MKLPDRKVVLSIGAHPDDTEFMCAGTLALLNRCGWEVHIASMTPGDKGSAELDRKEISKIRRAEGQKSAELLNGQCHCLECEDVYIMYDKNTINRVTGLLRMVRPSIVFTTSPTDYMVDHEIASRLTQTACFACGVRNMEVTQEPYEPVPWLYYMDPIEFKDNLDNKIEPGLRVDITSVMDIKAQMLSCHASQRNWLMAHHGIDEYINTMKEMGKIRGKEIDVEYAEGLRQHLGHSFPQENILSEVIGEFVHV